MLGAKWPGNTPFHHWKTTDQARRVPTYLSSIVFTNCEVSPFQTYGAGHLMRQRAIRKAGGEFQENKKLGGRYTECRVETHPLSSKKSPLNQLSCFLSGVLYFLSKGPNFDRAIESRSYTLVLTDQPASSFVDNKPIRFRSHGATKFRRYRPIKFCSHRAIEYTYHRPMKSGSSPTSQVWFFTDQSSLVLIERSSLSLIYRPIESRSHRPIRSLSHGYGPIKNRCHRPIKSLITPNQSSLRPAAPPDDSEAHTHAGPSATLALLPADIDCTACTQSHSSPAQPRDNDGNTRRGARTHT